MDEGTLEKSLRDLRELAQRDLYVFAKGVLGFDWLVPHIHLPLCRLLERFDEYPKLKITLPRGWLKTTLCSQSYPMWRAISNPNVRCLLVQNTFGNAVAKNRVINATFKGNDLFRTLWPEILPDRNCVWKQESMCIKRPKTTLTESTFEAAGAGTQVTSRHYDLIDEDDTVAPDLSDLGEQNLCPTKEDIVQAIGWHRLVPPLLVDPSKSQNLVVGTRWFEKDELSWIEENEPSFVSYTRSCREDSFGESCEDGEITYPERFNAKVLAGIRETLGPYMFSCLYLNKPLRSQDMVFDQEWIKYYETEPEGLICYTTVDPAGDPEETKSDPDFNVVLTTGKSLSNGIIYVLGYWRKRCNPSELISEVFKQVRKWHPVKVGVESVQYQASLKYWIKERMRKQNIYFLIEGLTHGRRSKNMRIMGLQPLVNSGKLRFRVWMTGLTNELLSFPLGAHDDLIDALSMQLDLWALTVTEKKRKEAAFGVDPMDVTSAIEELQERRGKLRGKGVMDVMSMREYAGRVA